MACGGEGGLALRGFDSGLIRRLLAGRDLERGEEEAKKPVNIRGTDTHFVEAVGWLVRVVDVRQGPRKFCFVFHVLFFVLVSYRFVSFLVFRFLFPSFPRRVLLI